MKKTLLLAGVACLFSFGANAEDYSLSELRLMLKNIDRMLVWIMSFQMQISKKNIT